MFTEILAKIKNPSSIRLDNLDLTVIDDPLTHDFLNTNTYYIRHINATTKVYGEKLIYNGIKTIKLYENNNESGCVQTDVNVLPFTKLLIKEEYNNNTSLYYKNIDKCKASGLDRYKGDDFVSNYYFYYHPTNTTSTEQPVTKETGGKRAKSRRQKRRTRKTRKHRKPSKK